jgi:hypothetical protein
MYNKLGGMIDGAMRGLPNIDKYETIRQIQTALPTADMTKAQTKDIHERLGELIRQRVIDVHMDQYMRWAQPMLDRIHILTNPDLMLQFQGALGSELKRIRSISKDPQAPLTEEDVTHATSNLISREDWGRFSSVYRFQVPKGYWNPARLKQYKQATGDYPSPQEMYNVYQEHVGRVKSGQSDYDPKIDPLYVQKMSPRYK